MASEIGPVIHVTGAALRAVLLNTSGQVWNRAGAAWGAPSAVAFADALITLTESGTTGVYYANLPAGVATNQDYRVAVYLSTGTDYGDTSKLLYEADLLQADAAQLAAIKAKTDTLGGAGSIAKTYTVTDSANNLPLAGVYVRVTTDAAGSNTVAAGYTDQNGQVTFQLNAGTVYLWRSKTGVVFTNPDVEEVS